MTHLLGVDQPMSELVEGIHRLHPCMHCPPGTRVRLRSVLSAKHIEDVCALFYAILAAQQPHSLVRFLNLPMKISFTLHC
jgi:hypothetical protein